MAFLPKTVCRILLVLPCCLWPALSTAQAAGQSPASAIVYPPWTIADIPKTAKVTLLPMPGLAGSMEDRVTEISRYVELAKARKDFGFVLAEWDAVEVFWKLHPEQRPALVQAVSDGRVFCAAGAHLFLPAESGLSPQGLARLLAFSGREQQALLGQAATVAFLRTYPEDPLPVLDLLAQAGVSRLFILHYNDQDDLKTALYRAPGGGQLLLQEVRPCPEGLASSGDFGAWVSGLYAGGHPPMTPVNPVYPFYCDPQPSWEEIADRAEHWNQPKAKPKLALAGLSREPLPQKDVPAFNQILFTPEKADQAAFPEPTLVSSVEWSLLTAEKFAAVAALAGRSYPGKAVDRAWRSLFYAARADASSRPLDPGALDRLTALQECLDLSRDILARSKGSLPGGLGASTAADFLSLPDDSVEVRSIKLAGFGQELRRAGAGERPAFIVELAATGSRKAGGEIRLAGEISRAAVTDRFETKETVSPSFNKGFSYSVPDGGEAFYKICASLPLPVAGKQDGKPGKGDNRSEPYSYWETEAPVEPGGTDAQPLTVSVSSPRLELKPGTTGSVNLTLVNNSQDEVAGSVTILRPPQAWHLDDPQTSVLDIQPDSPRTFTLKKRGHQEMALTVATSLLANGTYTLYLRIKARGQKEQIQPVEISVGGIK